MSARISQRIKQMQPSATLAMAAMSSQLQSQGIDMINLSLGEPDFDTPSFIKQAAKSALDEGYTKYTPVPGLLKLRQAIADKYKRENDLDYRANQVIVSNGAKQSVSNLLFSILNPGDEIIIFAPYWVSYYEMVKLTGAIPVILSADVTSEYTPSASALEAVITDKTRAILYSSPSNPTGSVFSKETLSSYAEVLLKHPQILVLSDEIYEYINFSPPHVSMAQIEGMKDRTAIVNGFSKGFAMTGWRLGYMLGPQWLVEACTKMQSQITSGATAFGQKAAVSAIREGKMASTTMVEVFRKRRDFMLKEIRGIEGVQCTHPEGAFYLFPDFSSYFGKSHNGQVLRNADDLTTYLLQHAHVALVSGTAFGEDRCIRLSYAASDDLLAEAMQRIRTALAELT